jgi:hypothetical protein
MWLALEWLGRPQAFQPNALPERSQTRLQTVLLQKVRKLLVAVSG